MLAIGWFACGAVGRPESCGSRGCLLEGPFPILSMPYFDDGAVDFDSLAAQVRFLAKFAVSRLTGFWTHASCRSARATCFDEVGFLYKEEDAVLKWLSAEKRAREMGCSDEDASTIAYALRDYDYITRIVF